MATKTAKRARRTDNKIREMGTAPKQGGLVTGGGGLTSWATTTLGDLLQFVGRIHETSGRVETLGYDAGLKMKEG